MWRLRKKEQLSRKNVKEK